MTAALIAGACGAAAFVILAVVLPRALRRVSPDPFAVPDDDRPYLERLADVFDGPLRPEPWTASCCGSTQTPTTAYHSQVCSCRITCRLPGPMPEPLVALIEPLSSDDNRRLLDILTARWVAEAAA